MEMPVPQLGYCQGDGRRQGPSAGAQLVERGLPSLVRAGCRDVAAITPIERGDLLLLQPVMRPTCGRGPLV